MQQMIRKINRQLAVSGQISPEQLPQIPQAGYRSILNIMDPDERGFWRDESLEAIVLGLTYVNTPIAVESLMQDTVTLSKVLEQIAALPKPMVVHCDHGTRSAALALIYIATQQGRSLSQAVQYAQQLGLFGSLAPV